MRKNNNLTFQKIATNNLRVKIMLTTNKMYKQLHKKSTVLLKNQLKEAPSV